MSLSRSVELKLDRAHEHAAALEHLVRTWEQPSPHRFASEVEDDSDPDYVHLRYFVRISKLLPSEDLSVVLGDCLNNYRAVLDHLIWELSLDHSGPNPPNPYRIKFPGRAQGAGSGGLGAISHSARKEVQWLHANCAAKDAGDPSPFLMLCELSNVDKHSAIHVIHHYPKKVEITTTPTIIGTSVEIVHQGGPLVDRTVIARIAIPRPQWVPDVVAVRAKTAHGIVIAATARTPIAHLGLTMEGIKDAVDEATRRLGNLLP